MMRLLKLPPRVQELLQAGSLNAAQGKALLRFEGFRERLIELRQGEDTNVQAEDDAFPDIAGVPAPAKQPSGYKRMRKEAA